MNESMKILLALVKKELIQIKKDPSSIIIAFILPLISIALYAWGINLDTPNAAIGIKINDKSQEMTSLVDSFNKNDFVSAFYYDDENKMTQDIIRDRLQGGLIIQEDFTKKLSKGQSASVLVIADGAQTNSANYVQNYSSQILNNWFYTSKFAPLSSKQIIKADTRVWYNQEMDSHYFILPGSIAITTTLIGILLTALVVAREWERGTMEGLLSTNVKVIHLVLGKYIPYFLLGAGSMAFNVFLCIGLLDVPFRGSLLVLFFVNSLFIITCLGVGLLISTKLKNQFLASQAALAIGFLPALLLSGLMFPINSMPEFFQYFTMILAPRHYITFIESEFMAGTIPEIVLLNSIYLSVLGTILFIAVYKQTKMRLE